MDACRKQTTYSLGNKPCWRNTQRRTEFSFHKNLGDCWRSSSFINNSSVYERYYEYDTVIYHHILDATTGYPINNHLTGVTIICPSSTRADALSTTCFVLGEEQAQAYIHTLEDTECILIDSEGNIIP